LPIASLDLLHVHRAMEGEGLGAGQQARNANVVVFIYFSVGPGDAGTFPQ
jgi:hypothetical protein